MRWTHDFPGLVLVDMGVDFEGVFTFLCNIFSSLLGSVFASQYIRDEVFLSNPIGELCKTSILKTNKMEILPA